MTIRNIIGFSLYHIVRPFVELPDVLSLYFHNPAPEAFESIVKWAISEGYEFRDVDSLRRCVTCEETREGKMAVVTLDDAWQTNLDLLPLIEKYNVPVAIFAPVEPLITGNYWWEYVGKKGGVSLQNVFKEYDEVTFNTECAELRRTMTLDRSAMTIEQLKRVSEHPLVTIGCHSYTHPILTKVSDANLEQEIRGAKQRLEEITGREVTTFSYPNGSFTEREAKMVRETFGCAFTVVQDSPRKGGDVFAIPRFAMTNDFWSNLAKIVGAWRVMSPFIKSK